MSNSNVSKSRVAVSVKFNDSAAFNAAIEEISTLVEEGKISKENWLYVQFSKPEFLASVDALVPRAEGEEEDLAGLSYFGEKQEQVRTLLMKKVSPDAFMATDLLAAHLGRILNPTETDIEKIQSNSAKAKEWIKANSSADGDTLLVSKKGRNSGVSLRKSI